jgi:PilZ domain
MDSSLVRIERRVGQRFPYLLPVCLREIATGEEVLGFTQDVSSRGVFLFVDKSLQAGAEIEITLKMPSEITLGENMRVRCRGRVLRIVAVEPKTANLPVQSFQSSASAPVNICNQVQVPTKFGVALRLDGYEYLPEPVDGPASFQRVAALHSHTERDTVADDRSITASSVRPVLS